MGQGLGRFLEQRRTELGFSRRELAMRSGLSYPYISQIETGDREPALNALRKLAPVLEVPVEQLAALLSGEGWTSSGRVLSGPVAVASSQGASADRQRRDKLVLSFERRLRDVPPVERLAILNELIGQAVQELQDEV